MSSQHGNRDVGSGGPRTVGTAARKHFAAETKHKKI